MAAAVFVGLMGPAAAPAQEATRFLRWTYQDAGGLAYGLGTHLPVYMLGSTALLLPGSRVDAPLLEHIQGGYRGTWSRYLSLTNELGGPHVVYPLVGVFALTLATDNARLQDAAFTSLQAWLYAGVLSSGFKKAFGRFRPETGADPHRFAPFSGHTSFPSGHTTAAFAIVTPWVLYYPNVATYGLFALSTGTALARIALDKHWPTDVLAGAALGFLTARWLARRHQQQDARRRLSIIPTAGPETAGLTLHYRLD